MLRIFHQPAADSTLVLRLEGKLLAPWISEAEQAFAAALARSSHIALDLAAVDFADAAGLEWLRRTARRGTAITACSGYLAELLSESPS